MGRAKSGHNHSAPLEPVGESLNAYEKNWPVPVPAEQKRKLKICIVARKDLTYNTRVVRQAKVLSDAGHHVTVISQIKPNANLIAIAPGVRILEINLFAKAFLIDKLRVFAKRRRRICPIGSDAKARQVKRKQWLGTFWNRLLLPILIAPCYLLLLVQRPNPEQLKEYKSVLLSGNGLALLDYLLTPIAQVLRNIQFAKAARELVKGESYDLVQAHDDYALAAGRMLSAATKAALIYDAVELPEVPRGWSLSALPPWLDRVEKRYQERVIKEAAEVITVSPSIAKWMQKRYEISRPAVIRNCRFFEPEQPNGSIRRDIGLQDGQQLALYLNSLYPGQGLEQFIQAALYLPPNVHLATLGPEGKPGFVETIRELARNLGVVERFHVLPPKPPDEMLAYASGADLGVIPRQNSCLNNYFSLPNRVFELVMARLPIACSNLPDITHLVESMGIGRSFKETDPRDIAEVIELMLQPEVLSIYKKAAREAARELCWEKEGARYLSIIEQAI
jgi:glycosyltransferase involved in cell wall biosynthesis